VTVAVIVPWRADCPHRARALTRVCRQYAAYHPDWEVIKAPAPAGPWSKGAAVMPTVDQCAADIVVVADADVWCDATQAAVDAVRGGAPWAMPHRKVERLTAAATEVLLAGGPLRRDLDEPAYDGRIGGGIVVARRETLLDIPMDPRFQGWGREDEAFGYALHVLAGPAWRGSARLIHLWHPPQSRNGRKRGSAETERLFKRYRQARTNRHLMRALINEIGDLHAEARESTHDGRDRDSRHALVDG
jgi:hypothetical protein